jgi:2-polyprenyl-3-methyl-5-hydroxy-6-metoxy-1,4-benzoquinol methylase
MCSPSFMSRADGMFSDRQTHDLLKKLNPSGSPSFYPYGTMPPATVLDLGCGQGHWILEAAVAWKGYGTRVTGVDMVDVAKNLRNMAAKHGVADNVQFVKSNLYVVSPPPPQAALLTNITYAIA